MVLRVSGLKGLGFRVRVSGLRSLVGLYMVCNRGPIRVFGFWL